MIENETKKGEANRTLRRKNQLLNEERASLEYKLKQADAEIDRLEAKLEDALERKHAARLAAHEFADRFSREVQLIRGWISESGIPTQRLDSLLNAEFKGTIPSHSWQSNMDAARLSSAINQNEPHKQP